MANRPSLHSPILLLILAGMCAVLFLGGVPGKVSTWWIGKPAFVRPAPDRIAALLDFTGPVALAGAEATQDELSQRPKRGIQGIPLALYAYSDPKHTAYTFTVAVYLAGDFMGQTRAGFFKIYADLLSNANFADGIRRKSGGSKIGEFTASHGRKISQFPLGEDDYFALLRCLDARYELVIEMDENGDNPTRNPAFSNEAPKKDLKSVIEGVEGLVFQRR